MDLNDEDARKANSLLKSPSWAGYYEQRLKAEFKNRLNALAMKKSADDDLQRGWIQALNWALTFPQNDIDEYAKAAEEQKKSEEDDAAAESIAQRGFHSPYIEGGKEH